MMEEIDEGGYGRIFKCKSHKYGHSAIKRIKIKDNLGNILKEINTLRFLKHPNVVAYRSMSLNKSRNTAVVDIEMALWDMDLYDYLTNHTLTLESAFKVFLGILNPLILMHQHGLYHLDIKPGNVLVNIHKGEIKEVCICDFGCGGYFEVSEHQGIGTTITRPPENFIHYAKQKGEVMFKYMESITESEEHYSHHTDVFACGVMLLYLLTGKYLLYETECENTRDYPEDALCKYFGDPKGFIKNKMERYSKFPEYNSMLEVLNLMLTPVRKNRPELIEIYKHPLFEKLKPLNKLVTQVRIPININYKVDRSEHQNLIGRIAVHFDHFEKRFASYKLATNYLDLILRLFMEKKYLTEMDIDSCFCISHVFFGNDEIITTRYISKKWKRKEIELNCLVVAKFLNGLTAMKSPFWYCSNMDDFDQTLNDYLDIDPYMNRKIHQSDKSIILTQFSEIASSSKMIFLKNLYEESKR